APLDLPQDFWVVVLLTRGAEKTSTADVYAAFDARKGAAGWAERRQALLDGLAGVGRPRDLAGLLPNDLAGSPLADEMRARGAFRADVSGAGPAVYGSSKQAGWFRRHRFRIVLWVAVAEGIVVAVTHGLHITTIVVLGIIAV